MMNKALVWCGVVVSLSSVAAEARTLAEIKKSKELRACIADVDGVAWVEPTGCTAEKCTSAKGASPDIVNLFAKSLGVKVKVYGVLWDQQFWNKEGKTVRGESYVPDLMATGKCDIYPSHLTKVEWRTKLLDFAILFPSRMMVVVRKDKKAEFKGPDSLAGKTSAIQKDTSFHTWLEAENKTTYAANPVKFTFVEGSEQFKSVVDKKADFTLGDTDMSFYATSKQYKDTAVAFPVGPVDEIGWAVAKGNAELLKAINDFFEAGRKDAGSELNKIWKSNFNLDLIQFTSAVSAVK